MLTADIAIIGAGIAGASLAAELAALLPQERIAVFEAEPQPGYHATGRSAAFWDECYGGPQIVPLTQASGPYLAGCGVLAPRGALYLAPPREDAAVANFLAAYAGSGVTLQPMGRTELGAQVPGLRGGWDSGVWQPACADIDVAALHAHYLARARSAGVDLRTRAAVAEIHRTAAGWRLVGHGVALDCGTLVNAAGAWADEVARLAGIGQLGITPLRRTMVQLRVDPPPPPDLPLVIGMDGSFYFRPDGARLWLSPHDETPSAPCDAAAEELDVALALHRFGEVADWPVAAIEHRWAGLRSFAPDRLPVYGRDPRDGAFVWFAGQGGFGIQTAPAAARLTAQLLAGAPRDSLTDRLDPALYAPDRLAA